MSTGHQGQEAIGLGRTGIEWGFQHFPLRLVSAFSASSAHIAPVSAHRGAFGATRPLPGLLSSPSRLARLLYPPSNDSRAHSVSRPAGLRRYTAVLTAQDRAFLPTSHLRITQPHISPGYKPHSHLVHRG
ncbi:hypothetical protein A1Q2_01541 [Trichosporon asahii var. asahii CBS 8904]|uniref:Uncharacterized protein n=1 Tax=Trichosporon asahii var. asahii (strain CBS 8904) TaxID=1220162 RepID=K1VU64_TRIAC|nr:hypothetical protein A1Q2_01541 [Trichosporon asahii var. asahii CBS 8904]